MNHFKISLVKSALRLLGSAVAVALIFINLYASVTVLAASYGFAEILGVLEEVFDKRKEN